MGWRKTRRKITRTVRRIAKRVIVVAVQVVVAYYTGGASLTLYQLASRAIVSQIVAKVMQKVDKRGTLGRLAACASTLASGGLNLQSLQAAATQAAVAEVRRKAFQHLAPRLGAYGMIAADTLGGSWLNQLGAAVSPMPNMQAPKEVSILLNAASGGFRAGLYSGIPDPTLLVRALELTVTGLLGNSHHVGHEIVRAIFSTLSEQFRVADVVDVPYEETQGEEGFFDSILGTGANFDRQRAEAVKQQTKMTEADDDALVGSLLSYAVSCLSDSPEECLLKAEEALQDLMDGTGNYKDAPPRLGERLRNLGAKIDSAAPDCVAIGFKNSSHVVLGYRGSDVPRDAWSDVQLFFTGRDETRILAAKRFAEDVYQRHPDADFIHGGHSLGAMPAYHVGKEGDAKRHSIIIFNGAPVHGLVGIFTGRTLRDPLPANVKSFHAAGDVVGFEHLLNLKSILKKQIQIVPAHNAPAVGSGAFASHKLNSFFGNAPMHAVPTSGNPHGRHSSRPTPSDSSSASSSNASSSHARPSPYHKASVPPKPVPKAQNANFRPTIRHPPKAATSSSRPRGNPALGSTFSTSSSHPLG